MKITWTEPGVECSLAVYWRSEDGNSVNSRFATLVDLKRASEVAGMLHDYVDRDEAFEKEQKLKVRLAVLEAEQAAYLDALAIEGIRPTTVMIGIESLKSALDAEIKELADADALISRVSARAEKAEGNLAAAQRRIVEVEAQLQAAQDTSIADRAMDKFYAEGIDPHGVLHGIDLAIERAKKAEAERDLAKHDFELASEAYDELQARFDELASSPERIALLEALEPHDPNAACAAASMKREHEAALAVLGASDGEDLISAARRAVSMADLYRTHYRRTVISNAMTDRAMTEGLAECERLRARIAELETAAAKRESLRDLMEKAAEARLSCGLYIPREGLIEVGVGRGGQTHADTPKSAVLELERLLRERVGAGNTL